MGGSLRVGGPLNLNSNKNPIIETGLDLYDAQAKLANSSNEEMKLYQAIVSVPFIILWDTKLNNKENKKFCYGVGPSINIIYSSGLIKPDLPINQITLEPENKALSLGLQGDIRIKLVKENGKGFVFGIRTNTEVYNISVNKESIYPLSENPLFVNITAYYNLCNVKM